MSYSGKSFIWVCAVAWLLAGRAWGETVYWSENFDTNAASRWSTNKVWRISSPTGGPVAGGTGYRTHSGARCANTQNYKANTDARLVCTSYINGTNVLVVPSADEYPRLRFWHWFNFSGSTLGFVEISTDQGGSWTQISPTYESITSSGVWSCPYIDLSAYAGQSVQFAFRFYGLTSGNGYGWYIDDVSVETDEPVESFPEGFEFDPKLTDWSVDGGTWEIGKPASGPGSAHTGTNCAATVLAGNYANYVDTRLISPLFTVPDSASAILHFWQWYNFSSALGFVEINDNSITVTVTTTTTITTNITATLNTNVYQLSGASLAAFTNLFYWNPTIHGWTNSTAALGNVFDTVYGAYYFEAGLAPLAAVNYDTYYYRPQTVVPLPQSTKPTNFLTWQGLVWYSRTSSSDSPVGYFGTNYTYTYTTNTTVATNQSSWTQVSATFQGGSTLGEWVEESVDLGAYAGETVQLAFHFGSAAGSASGWYVDDVSVQGPPTISVPDDQTISYGQTFTNTVTADNSLAGSTFTFSLAAASTNVVLKTNGLLTWTNKITHPGTYSIYPKVTDNYGMTDTNSFSVTVLPLASQFNLTNAVQVGRYFKFNVKTPWTNDTWRILAATNLSANITNWVPVYTNAKSQYSANLIFTDRLATNFLDRYYRTVYP